MALWRSAVDPVPPVLCNQISDKALNRNAVQHGDGENDVIVLTTNFVRPAVKNGGIGGFRPCGGIRRPPTVLAGGRFGRCAAGNPESGARRRFCGWCFPPDCGIYPS